MRILLCPHIIPLLHHHIVVCLQVLLHQDIDVCLRSFPDLPNIACNVLRCIIQLAQCDRRHHLNDTVYTSHDGDG